MVLDQMDVISLVNTSRRLKSDNLARALYRCWDLTTLHKNPLINLPGVRKRALHVMHGYELAKALRLELIACAEQITQRPVYPIRNIVMALEKETREPESSDVVKIRKKLGIPFSRYRLDLARYYTVRLIMEGVDRQTIADFLDVDIRTVANYMSQAKEHIRLILESSLMPDISRGSQL